MNKFKIGDIVIIIAEVDNVYPEIIGCKVRILEDDEVPFIQFLDDKDVPFGNTNNGIGQEFKQNYCLYEYEMEHFDVYDSPLYNAMKEEV